MSTRTAIGTPDAPEPDLTPTVGAMTAFMVIVLNDGQVAVCTDNFPDLTIYREATDTDIQAYSGYVADVMSARRVSETIQSMIQPPTVDPSEAVKNGFRRRGKKK